MVASSAAGADTAGKGGAVDEEEGGDAAGGGAGGEPGCSMDELVGLCKRRGFVFPSSEVCVVCVFVGVTRLTNGQTSVHACVYIFASGSAQTRQSVDQ